VTAGETTRLTSRAEGDVVLGPLALDATALPSLGDGR